MPIVVPSGWVLTDFRIC